jgi:hypothetical protein
MAVRRISILLLVAALLGLSSCAAGDDPATPKETFLTYSKARKKKDFTTMKMLLSDESKKMHEQEAKAMGVTVDDIVERETLVSESQSVVKVRNEKIEGERATLEVENSFGSWETLPFIFENGQWKIDKKGYADRLMQDIEQINDQKLDQIIQGGGADPGFPPAGDNTNSNSLRPY